MLIETFERQVERYSARTALKTGIDSLTYEQLNLRANRLAHAILGSCPEAAETGQAALLFEKGMDMIVSMLGVLKAGLAYVPLDITYPEQRLAYMVEHSDSRVLVTNRRNRELAESVAREVKKRSKLLRWKISR